MARKPGKETLSRADPALPAAYLARMEALLGADYPAFLRAYADPPQHGLRVNTLKVTPDHFATVAPFQLTPNGMAAEAFLVAETDRPGAHPYHAAGLYYLQDPAAMAVALALDPQPGERILDLAAAPGGKATHIAARLAGRGALYANEIHPKRVWDLAENLERWGARNAVVLHETPARLADRLPGWFDRVLLDAPCSGEGLFRKQPAARAEWSPALVEGCARRQDGLLTEAARLVRPGGALVYATCTFAPEEDEGAIARFLTDHPAFDLLAPAPQPGYAPGHPEWVAADAPAALARTVRLWPHRGPGEGHFIAVLRRRDDAAPMSGGPAHRPARPDPATRSAIALYHAFCRDHLAGVPAEDGLTLAGAYLYAIPEPDLPGDLHAVHPGWWLGVVKTARFEPSHALAMALTPRDVQRSRDLPPADPRLTAFLLGQGFADAGDSGWVLVTVDGFPVGWGKRAAGVLKSHYPKGLRRPPAGEAAHA